ncbi:MAG: NAD(P)/FAD-dependent oxidoreductase [Xanthobacteraceae bacterium]
MDFDTENAHALYHDTARPAPAAVRLDGDRRVSVAIIGAGFTGLSAALHLAEAGVDVAVLEAREPGWGASGRNGGQVNPGLKWEPDQIEAAFGPELGGRMAALGAGAPDLVFALVERLGIACEAHRGGTLRAAVNAASERSVRASAEQWARRGAPVAWLDGPACARITGTGAYRGASLDRRGGSLNPLGYARGLAEAAVKAGAAIYSRSGVETLRREDKGWVLSTASGTLRAEHVLIGTNGYSDGLWPGLARSVAPVFSAITATEPLPPEVLAAIMPGRPVLYEISARYAYYRLDAHGRFLMGGRSALRASTAPADYRPLVEHAERLFPALAGRRWSHAWNGRVAVTADHLPHLHEPAPGLHIGLGYNGRGVAMATAMGRLLARRVLGARDDELDLPVTGIKPMPFHAFWPVGVRLRLAYGTLMERLGF